MILQLIITILFTWVALVFVEDSTLSAQKSAAGSKSGIAGTMATHHPKGWQFTMPRGEPLKGRAVFEKYECYDCHEVRGESFPYPTSDPGPELTQMGPLHPREYFTESVIHPDAWVEKKYRSGNGGSKMLDVNDRMTVQELVDLSAYLASLRPPKLAKSVTAVGKVVAVIPQNREIVIAHEEIKGVMDAMTMGYKVSTASQLAGLTAGDSVTFTLDTEKRLIVKIVKVKE